jgi:hypothetical protein
MIKQSVREEDEIAIHECEPITLSVIPAIDEIVAEMSGRELVSAAEVVDRFLDLRLIAVADEVLANAH